MKVDIQAFGDAPFHSLVVSLVIVVLSPLLPCPASDPQGLAEVNIPLHVSTQGNLERFWKVWGAKLSERLEGTTGHLQVQNTSDFSLDDAIFYGEYLDARGRFCFSLVFSQAENIGEKGPVAPGEIRDLYTDGYGLAPGAEPSEVKLYLIQQSDATGAILSPKEEKSIRAPVTLNLMLPDDEDKLQLGPEATSAASTVLDLVLAEVTVEEDGALGQVRVIDAADTGVKAWFLRFVHDNMVFYPATDEGLPKAARTLILVRAISAYEKLRNFAFAPRTCAWVKSYELGLKGADVPVVNEIILGRPPTKVKRLGSTETTELRSAPPGLFQVESSGSDWSSPAFHWITDPSKPHHLRRELKTIPN